MQKKFQVSLIETILNYRNISADTKIVYMYLNSQIKKMPDYMMIPIYVIGFFVNIVSIITTLKRFSKLDIKKRIQLSLILRNLPIFKIFYRFYESITILKGLEISK
tara:strand:- start:1819 stop:2136 length:318 start_codon:yes stop_codon:yes gene_type:complete